MADTATGWPVPSFKGRIVAAEHFEYFTPDQARRREDATLFMTPGTSTVTRAELLERYGVRWILIDRDNDAAVLAELAVPQAVERQVASLILVDAGRWLRWSEAAGAGGSGR